MVVIMVMTTNNSHHNANTTTFCPAPDLDLQELLAREQAQGNGQQGQGRGIDACVAQAHREGVLQSLYGLLTTYSNSLYEGYDEGSDICILLYAIHMIQLLLSGGSIQSCLQSTTVTPPSNSLLKGPHS